MGIFEKRQEAFERKFVHEQEIQFRANARWSNILGLWAAAHLDIDENDYVNYAKQLVNLNLEGGGEDALFRKVREDFDRAGVKKSDHQIRRTMDELKSEALTHVMLA
jgi:hypothetical protein